MDDNELFAQFCKDFGLKCTTTKTACILSNPANQRAMMVRVYNNEPIVCMRTIHGVDSTIQFKEPKDAMEFLLGRKIE